MKRAAVLLGGALAALLSVAVLLDRIFPPNLSRLDAVGTEVLDREGRTLALLPARGGVWRFRTAVEDVSPAFLDLLLRTEDRHFWRHPGVDPLALGRASFQWLRAGRVVSGGSTLTMQAARLLEPRPRTLRAKAVEILRALQLEAHFSKREILGVWLTLAPYGGNLEGVRAGSQAWFGVRPALLDPAQAALLVAIPRRPEALRPDRHPDRARVLRDRLLGGPALAAEAPPVPPARSAFPRHAPQLVAGLPRPEDGQFLRTTLDAKLQAALERMATERLLSLPDRASLAILVADLRTREARAIVSGGQGAGAGAAGEARAGSLDLTRAVRSPGSALKPMLYALAFQDGLATPDTPLPDLPQHFGGYAPENYDRTHAGRVTAAEALRRSLNLPAVVLLDRLGPVRFAASLTGAGAHLRLPVAAEPSLPLALGGVGITLRDLAALYAALATDGTVVPLRVVPADAAGGDPSRRLVQPAAARLVADVLTHALPEGGPGGIAWKTGTSWGGRDALALGFDRRSLVAVWIGRPDGTAMPGATGRALALPLLGRVFGLLPAAPRDPPRPPAAPAGEGADTLRLLFPPPGAVLSADGPVPLRAMGGRRPLTFLVDGAPVMGEPARRQATWRPDGPGFYTVSVLDADGASVRARIRVR